MSDLETKKMALKVKCEICDKELCKASLKRHMKDQHNKEVTSKKNEESSKTIDEPEDKEDDSGNENTEEVGESNIKTKDDKVDSNETTKESTRPEQPIVVHDLINLDTKELESLLENQDEFLEAVKVLEHNQCLDVDLSINESMIEYMQDPNNYRSDFAKTVELEEVDKSKKNKLEKELETSKKTIIYLRKSVKFLRDECTNGVKEYKGVSNRYKTSKRNVRTLENELKENRELLANTSKEIVVLKQKTWKQKSQWKNLTKKIHNTMISE